MMKILLTMEDHKGNNFMHLICKLNDKKLLEKFINDDNYNYLLDTNEKGKTPIDYCNTKLMKHITSKNIDKISYLEYKIKMNLEEFDYRFNMYIFLLLFLIVKDFFI